jgi:hypothetical protein
MANKIVTNAEFGNALLEEVKRRYNASKATSSPKEGFLQEHISVKFIVLAGANSAEEPCCVCYHSSAGIICSGDCCADVIDAVVLEPV